MLNVIKLYTIYDIHLLRLDLDSLTNWSHTNHLFFKAAKCNSIRFKPISGVFEGDPYSIDGCKVSKKVSHRDLGIIFSAHMSWHCHYEFIVGKAYKVLGLLRRTFKCSNSILIKKFYIYILLDRVYCIAPPYGGPIKSNTLSS